jgi:uncharacterized membrane protein YdbT with pleckstrin-like domain
MEIKPDKKLITKLWLTLLTISVLIVIVSILCTILVPLSGKTTSEHVGEIVWPIAIAAIVLMWVIGVPAVVLWVNNLSYNIEDERVTIHKGILTKIQQNIPYRAVTDFMLYRSLYDRFLGLASIKIQTAGQGQRQGGAGYEGKLSGLTDWDSLVTELRKKIK